MIALRTLVKSGKAPWRTLYVAAATNGHLSLANSLCYANATKLTTIRTRTRKSSLTTKTYQVSTAAKIDESGTGAGADLAANAKGGSNNGHKTVPMTFIEEGSDGSIEREIEVQAVVGKHLLDVAHANNVELEGACGGELACSTCHVVFEPEFYGKLPPKGDEEDDMLDLAFSVTETSRLGCQIPVKEDYAGMKLRIPYDGMLPVKPNKAD